MKRQNLHPYQQRGLVTRAVWVEPAEAERIRLAAERAGLSQGAWMRRQLLRGAPARRGAQP
jgi:mobilization protein NikA